jgi:hypothetical protein
VGVCGVEERATVTSRVLGPGTPGQSLWQRIGVAGRAAAWATGLRHALEAISASTSFTVRKIREVFLRRPATEISNGGVFSG